MLGTKRRTLRSSARPHPTQPILQDGHGELRFRANQIVRRLLDRDGSDLEQLEKLDVPPEDHVQVAQLLGYAVSDRRFDAIRSALPPHVVRAKGRKCYDPQPMQPVYQDEHGTPRFRENEIVRILLDRDSERGRRYPDCPAQTDGGLNWIAMQGFSREDQEQFAQLIGYSVGGYHELDYVSNASAARASKLADEILPGAGGCRDAGCEIHGGPLSSISDKETQS